VIPLVLTRRSLDQVTLRSGELLLHALARSGRSGTDLLAALRTVSGFVNGFAQAELTSPLSVTRGESVTTVTGRVRSLPPERFPYLIEVAETATTSTPEKEFHAGLDIVLAGLVSVRS